MGITEEQMRRRWSLPLLLLGIAIPILWTIQGPKDEHGWMIYIVGAAFLCTGVLCWMNQRSPVTELVAGIVLLLMSVIGFFAAFGPHPIESESSGVLVLIETMLITDAQSQSLGRFLFGAGAALTAALGLLLLIRSLGTFIKRKH
jgi:hypothetical protein